MLNNFTYDNNVFAALENPITSADTSFMIAGYTAPNKPIPATASPSRPAVLTIVDNIVAPTKIEIVYAQSVSQGHGDPYVISSVLRGQEGTTAQDWQAGSIVFQALTRAMLNPPEVTLPTIKGVESLDFKDGGKLYPDNGSPRVIANNLAVDGQFDVLGHAALAGGVTLAAGTPPANSGASGSPGEIRWNSSYLFICVGGNNWKRVALSAF